MIGGCDVADVAVPTFGHDVAPLLARSCLSCHDGSTAGQRVFARYDDVVAQRELMWAAMASGLMPPQGVDRSGACGDWEGARPIDDDDVALFAAWIDAGMPEGEATVPPPTAIQGRDDVDGALVIAGGAWIPRADATVALDQHRCFVVNGPVEPAMLVGLDVDASAATHLHHAMLFAVPAENAARAHALDVDGTGWDCDGPPRVGSTLVATWTPGAAQIWWPAGTGTPLSSTLILQLHSHGADDGAVDASRLRLFFSSSPQRTLAYVPIDATGFSLPPGLDVVDDARVTVLEQDLQVFGVLPHMHAAGRAIELRQAAGGCVVDVPAFDFGWQETAWLSAPRSLAAGSALELSCSWSTRERSTPTRWGESSDDEMCTVFLLAVAVP